MRDDLANRSPKAVESILRIQGIIDSGSMAKMSAKVRLDHQLETNVAAEYVNDKLGLSIPLQGTSRSAACNESFKRWSRQLPSNLFLVVVFLSRRHCGCHSAWNLIGASRQAWAGHSSGDRRRDSNAAFDGNSGFYDPLVRISPFPAIVALFFYSLLPIVRNTYAV